MAEANAKADEWLLLGKSKINASMSFEQELTKYNQYYLELECTRKGISVPTAPKNRDYGNKRVEISCLSSWGTKLSKKKITKLQDADIQAILDEAQAQNKAKKTITNIRSAFESFLKFCRQRGWTDYRMDEVKVPAGARAKGKTILQPDYLKTLFTNDQTMWRGKVRFDPEIYAYRFAVLTGLRPGELLALDVEDWEGDVLHIRGSINDSGMATKGKNENAIRDVRLFEEAKEQVEKQCQLTGRKRGKMFDFETQLQFRGRWYTYCNHNGIPHITPYELRHTFVSIAQQLPDGLVKPIVGHSKNMDTFGVYGHGVDGYDTIASQQLSKVFKELLPGLK